MEYEVNYADEFDRLRNIGMLNKIRVELGLCKVTCVSEFALHEVLQKVERLKKVKLDVDGKPPQ